MLRYLIYLSVFPLGLVSANLLISSPSAWIFIDFPNFIAVVILQNSIEGIKAENIIITDYSGKNFNDFYNTIPEF